MKLFWTKRAQDDLRETRRFIAADSPMAAKRWVARLRARARRAVSVPFSGRVVPEFAQDDIREFVLGNYRIVYEVGRDGITILTVFEGHRQIPLRPDHESGSRD